ncbi:MAG: GDSL-type esterase/lipase family protein [Clostridium sp.]|uniref:GDSL-type esterase/lipase family protein n=1 Tax=Clostridium sp. TaxID=1506 RepID=UPI003F2DEDB0
MLSNPIILIGDSLTFGYGISKRNSFHSLLASTLSNETILKKGINGDTSTGILTRFYRDVVSHNPKATFIMCGTNDLLSGRSVSSIISNIELMIKDLLSINSRIIIGIPPYIIKELAIELFSYSSYYDYACKSLIELQSEILNLKKKYPIEVLDFYNLTKSNLPQDIYIDGIHLNEKGNKLFFNSLLSLL